MLQRCSSNNTAFSILFPMTSSSAGAMDEGCSYYSSSSVVDCTLSLGTPSTRHTTTSIPSPCTQKQRSTFCWDHLIAQSSKPTAAATAQPTNSPSSCHWRGDPLLLARRCANCDTTSTPLWRNGPRGPKSLCNACGIRYKKEERRAAASSTSSTATAITTVNRNETTPSYSNYQSPQPQQYTWREKSSTTSSWIQNDHLHQNTNNVVDHMDVPNYGLSWRLSVVLPPHFQVSDRASPLFHFH